MKKFLTLFFLFFIINAVFSQEICTTSTDTDTIIITNHHTKSARYEISMDGSLAKFTELSHESFFLEPGESKVITLEFSFPFQKNYELNLNVIKNGAEIVYEKEYEYTAEECHELDAEIIQENEFCTLDENNYSIKVMNGDEYEETFNLTVNNHTRKVTLDKNESRIINYTYFAEDVDEDEIVVNMENLYINKNLVFNLNITNCDNYLLEGVNNHYVCEGISYEKNFTIKNTGKHKDTYYFSTKYENIELKDDAVSLEPNQTMNIYYNINSGCGELGMHLEGIRISSDNTDDEKFFKINYDNSNCFDMSVELQPLNDFCERDNKSFIIIVKNNGTVNNDYYAMIEAGDESLNKTFMLVPGEEKELRIILYNISKEEIKLNISANDYSPCPNKFSQEKSISVQSFEKCYSAYWDSPEIFYDNKLLMKVKNNGTRLNNYTLSILYYNEIDNNTFSLKPDETKNFRIKYLYNMSREYNITSFRMRLTGHGVNKTRIIEYSSQRITGLVIQTLKRASYFTGVLLLLLIIYFFIKK